jgi:hypothetical protein
VTHIFLNSLAEKTSSPALTATPGARVHPQIARAKLCALRDGAAIAGKKLLSRISKTLCGMKK